MKAACRWSRDLKVKERAAHIFLLYIVSPLTIYSSIFCKLAIIDDKASIESCPHYLPLGRALHFLQILDFANKIIMTSSCGDLPCKYYIRRSLVVALQKLKEPFTFFYDSKR
jgi:hypothetical protein